MRAKESTIVHDRTGPDRTGRRQPMAAAGPDRA